MKNIKRLLILAMSLCMTVGLLTMPIHAEEAETVTYNGPTTIEEVQEDIKTRSGTDEYYELISITYTSGEYYMLKENYSEYIKAGNRMVTQAYVLSVIYAPIYGSIAKAIWDNFYGDVAKESRYYSTVVDHYAKRADMYYKITNGMGDQVRYANYTGIQVPTRKVYSYS